ncbi:hypothetical protein UlMin_037320 [Ulmus minor]
MEGLRGGKPSTPPFISPVPPATNRRKGMGVKSWRLVSESGESHLEEVGKQSIMRRTGLPARDLRVMDPMLTCPSSIMGRERAIVVNLEHIKAIITAKELLMINSTNPLIVQFLHDLQQKLSSYNIDPPKQGLEMISSSVKSSKKMKLSRNSSVSLGFSNMAIEGGSPMSGKLDLPMVVAPKTLPFEFKALEACLESTCRCLESETQTLEEQAYPALDELTSQISTMNLERVRQIKSRLVAISGRVQKVRDELEHLLDDDNDMAEMYLTEKYIARYMDQTFPREDPYNTTIGVDDERAEEYESEENCEGAIGFKPDIQELEMLLEAYFAQIDGILQKLSDMKEYVDDTEDCINIMLDDKQNHMLQMGVLLNAINMIINAGIVVVGIFGMNIHISLFDGQPIQFWETVIGTVTGCVSLYLIAIGWGKKRYLVHS